ncbi:MAG: ABC transporter permease, partial [Pseudobdellovibrionaceae bacterium]|nr:ABC transporter permease [Pseudobdellovibrionaceae bacterium]
MMTFLVYAFKRLLLALPMLWLVLTVSFFLVRAAPGSPLDRDSELPAALKKSLAQQYGLDRPLLEQYVFFVKHAAVGDFGNSYIYRNRSVSAIIQEAFPISARLGILA